MRILSAAVVAGGPPWPLFRPAPEVLRLLDMCFLCNSIPPPPRVRTIGHAVVNAARLSFQVNFARFYTRPVFVLVLKIYHTSPSLFELRKHDLHEMLEIYQRLERPEKYSGSIEPGLGHGSIIDEWGHYASQPCTPPYRWRWHRTSSCPRRRRCRLRKGLLLALEEGNQNYPLLERLLKVTQDAGAVDSNTLDPASRLRTLVFLRVGALLWISSVLSVPCICQAFHSLNVVT
ncbi:hypothetical protein B0T25DRAFT_600203 [Lasiosphaeria hispida]|uniref:Uncharacterized protein n=1 Tax=Lasiosphaeria hispida TaxID=260671 RepID=A0AAJ0HPY5_9PEZI|nr:hypothetical protein B0T25DRAFT_600203 [Lasiosphaeria hispida]